MKFLSLLFIPTFLIGGFSAARAESGKWVYRPVDFGALGARSSYDGARIYNLSLFSGLPQIANVIIKADSGTIRQELVATLAEGGLRLGDFELLASSEKGSDDKVYLLADSAACEFSRQPYRAGEEKSAYDHLVCYRRPSVAGSVTLRSMTPERYRRAPSDVFDTIAKISPAESDGKILRVSLGPVICSEKACAAALEAAKPLVPLSADLSRDLNSQLIYEINARANASPASNSLLLGLEFIECTQKLDNKPWKDTTCVARWSPASTAEDRRKAIL